MHEKLIAAFRKYTLREISLDREESSKMRVKKDIKG